MWMVTLSNKWQEVVVSHDHGRLEGKRYIKEKLFKTKFPIIVFRLTLCFLRLLGYLKMLFTFFIYIFFIKWIFFICEYCIVWLIFRLEQMWNISPYFKESPNPFYFFPFISKESGTNKYFFFCSKKKQSVLSLN